MRFMLWTGHLMVRRLGVEAKIKRSDVGDID